MRKKIIIIYSCRYIGKNDGITISVWNYRKFHKKQNGGFLGCVRILSNTIQRLKDTGCMYLCLFYITLLLDFIFNLIEFLI